MINELLRSAFKGMEQADIDYCMIRDHDRLDQLTNGGEIDLLVRKRYLGQLSQLLRRLGFVKLPGMGHEPHHFFVGYDQIADCWLKLDIITDIRFGEPIKTLPTTLANNCLRNRQRNGLVFAPSPEDELVMLLLHCVLDKGHFAPARRQRLQILRHQITEENYISNLLESFWLPSTTWAQIAAKIDAEDWTILLSKRQEVTAHLASQNRVTVASHWFRDRLLRKLNSWVYARRPRSLVVALLAPDGAGKSTLAANIQNSFYFPVRSIYMGLYQKRTKSLGLWGLPGLSFVRRVSKQWQRYLIARYHQSRGRLVICDRYAYDALLQSPNKLSRLKQARRWLLAHTCPAPDLILLLDAPGDVLYARKGEHNPTFLEQQRQAYLKLQSYLPQMVVLDGTCDAEHLQQRVTSLIWRVYLGRQAGLTARQVIMNGSLAEIESSTI